MSDGWQNLFTAPGADNRPERGRDSNKRKSYCHKNFGVKSGASVMLEGGPSGRWQAAAARSKPASRKLPRSPAGG